MSQSSKLGTYIYVARTADKVAGGEPWYTVGIETQPVQQRVATRFYQTLGCEAEIIVLIQCLNTATSPAAVNTLWQSLTTAISSDFRQITHDTWEADPWSLRNIIFCTVTAQPISFSNRCGSSVSGERVGFIYLLLTDVPTAGQEQRCYKVGRTSKSVTGVDFPRINNYKKRNLLYLGQVDINEVKQIEARIIQGFNSRFQPVWGKEYFTGDPQEMLQEVYNAVHDINHTSFISHVHTLHTFPRYTSKENILRLGGDFLLNFVKCRPPVFRTNIVEISKKFAELRLGDSYYQTRVCVESILTRIESRGISFCSAPLNICFNKCEVVREIRALQAEVGYTSLI